MAVKVFCSDVIGAFTHCSPVAAIYTYGEQVWPMGPVPFGTWYVSWRPSDISGSFNMFGSTYSLEDYSGLFTWSGSTSGYIDGWFNGPDMRYMETNVKSIGHSMYGVFTYCSGLLAASMSRVQYLGSHCFEDCYSLERVYAPNLLSVSFMGFQDCSNLTSVDFPKCTYLDGSAFNRCGNISYVSLSNCVHLGTQAFCSCYMLQSVYLPKCSVVYGTAFSNCSSLSMADFPVCEEVGGKAFHNCGSLTDVSLPMCSKIGPSAFMNCTALPSIDLPLCETISTSAFKNCTSLSYISLPVCSFLSDDVFMGCTALRSIELPNLSLIYFSVFKGCTSLSYVDLGTCSQIYTDAFMDCTNLSTLVLRSTSIVSTFNGHDPFSNSNTPFERCEGSIYVPFGLYGTYIRTSPWSRYSCVITTSVPAPGSYYIEWTGSITYPKTFQLEGGTYYYEDFDGYFNWFDGVITRGAFQDTPVSTIETNAYSIDEGAFWHGKLVSISASACTFVGQSAFIFCSKLSYVTLPVCESLSYGAFDGCSYLRSIDLPSCKYVGQSAFWDCSRLSSINLPVCEVIEDSAFYSCNTLSTIDLPMCKSIGTRAFNSCTSLTSINLPVCEQIRSWAFANCSSLSTIKLEYSSVCQLESNNAFWSAGITSSTGSILVPASLVSDYKDSGSPWYSFRNRIFPIS